MAASRDDEIYFISELDDDELVIPTPWSDEGKNKIRARRLSGEYEFRNLMFELDFLLNYDEIKEKRSKETEVSNKEGVADVNQNVDKEKEKVSKEDVGKGMGEPEFQHVLEGEVEVDNELYHVQIDKRVLDEIEKHFMDDQPCYGPIEEA